MDLRGKIVDHNPEVDSLTIKQVIDWLEECYKENTFSNAFAWTRRIGIIQACDLYLAEHKNKIVEEGKDVPTV